MCQPWLSGIDPGISQAYVKALWLLVSTSEPGWSSSPGLHWTLITSVEVCLSTDRFMLYELVQSRLQMACNLGYGGKDAVEWPYLVVPYSGSARRGKFLSVSVFTSFTDADDAEYCRIMQFSPFRTHFHRYNVSGLTNLTPIPCACSRCSILRTL
jgi:hypothetical protein